MLGIMMTRVIVCFFVLATVIVTDIFADVYPEGIKRVSKDYNVEVTNNVSNIVTKVDTVGSFKRIDAKVETSVISHAEGFVVLTGLVSKVWTNDKLTRISVSDINSRVVYNVVLDKNGLRLEGIKLRKMVEISGTSFEKAGVKMLEVSQVKELE